MGLIKQKLIGSIEFDSFLCALAQSSLDGINENWIVSRLIRRRNCRRQIIRHPATVQILRNELESNQCGIEGIKQSEMLACQTVAYVIHQSRIARKHSRRTTDIPTVEPCRNW